MLPVHEQGDGRPAHPDPGRRAPGQGPEADHRGRPASAVLADKGASAHSWRTFQLAFILMQLPLLTDPAAARALGRPRQGRSCCSSPPAAARPRPTSGSRRTRSPSAGARASSTPPTGRSTGAAASRCSCATRCACSPPSSSSAPRRWCAPPSWRAGRIRRRGATSRSGSACGSAPTSARSGSTRPTSSSRKVNEGRGYRLTVLQIQRCPWCGTPIDARDVRRRRPAAASTSTAATSCAGCPFSEGGRSTRGCPS